MRILFVLAFISILAVRVNAQITAGADTLYGNEWINFSQKYYKIKIAADGLYRIPASVLENAGIPVAQIAGGEYQLYRNGVQIPVYVSSESLALTAADYIEFWGQKNRDELDRHLFENPAAENFNPEYSMFNDTSAYFLTWQIGASGLRYVLKNNDLTNPPAKEPYCWFRELKNFTTSWTKKQTSEYIVNSWFEGEGFGEAFAQNSNYQFQATGVYTAGPSAKLALRYAANLGLHVQQIKINGTLAATDSFDNWKLIQHQFLVNSSLLDGGLSVELTGGHRIMIAIRRPISNLNTRAPLISTMRRR